MLRVSVRLARVDWIMEDYSDEGDLSLGTVFTVSRKIPLSGKDREERSRLNLVLGTASSSYPRAYPLHLFTRTWPG